MSQQNTFFEEVALSTIFTSIKRHRYLILLCLFAGLLLGYIYLSVTPKVYTSEVLMQFNVRNQPVVDVQSLLTGGAPDESVIQSEVDLISSRELVRRIVKRYGLMEFSEFQFDPDPEGRNEEQLERYKRQLVVRAVRNNLTVSRKPKSYTVLIRYTSPNPDHAAGIANAVAKEFIDMQQESKLNVTDQANIWLNQRINELRERVEASAKAVQEYREANDLLELDGQTVSDTQLQELNTQLTIAQKERVTAEAKYQQATEGMNVESIPEVVNSGIIQQLKVQEAEVRRMRSDLSSRYGARHPEIQQVEAELASIRGKIATEIDNITRSLENEVKRARINEATLREKLTELEQKLGLSGRAEVKLAELQRELDANTAVYEAFLTRYKETSQQPDAVNYDARISSYAEIPFKPSWPSKKIILLLGLVLGTLAGLVLAFLHDILDAVVRNEEQLETITGLPTLTLFPELKKRKIKTRRQVTDYAIQHLTSSFAESLRAVLTELDKPIVTAEGKEKEAKTVMVTSSGTQEGKSVFAVSLARLAARSKMKIVLLDCDFRLPTVAEIFQSDASLTLKDILEEKASYEETVQMDEASGLHYVTAPGNTPYSRELLRSGRMEAFLEALKHHYDLIIIDAPPVMALSDTVILTRIADTVLFLARWGKTRRNVVKKAISILRKNDAHISGAIISRVDLKKYQGMQYGEIGTYYSDYKAYYND